MAEDEPVFLFQAQREINNHLLLSCGDSAPTPTPKHFWRSLIFAPCPAPGDSLILGELSNLYWHPFSISFSVGR